MTETKVNPTDLIKQMEKEIQSDQNYNNTIQMLTTYYDDFEKNEKNVKNLDGNFYKNKVFILMIDGKYQQVLNLKAKLAVSNIY